jgi:hypothetical protein
MKHLLNTIVIITLGYLMSFTQIYTVIDNVTHLSEQDWFINTYR